MKKGLFFGFLVSLVAMIGLAATTNFDSVVLTSYLSAGSYVRATTEVVAPEFQLGHGSSLDSLGRIVMNIRNKRGSALSKGHVVALDTTKVRFEPGKLLPNVTYTDTAGVVASEGAPNGVFLICDGTPTSDSFYIYGTTISPSGTSTTTEIINLGTNADDLLASNYVWNTIDSIKFDSGAAKGPDSMLTYLLPYRGVTLAVAASVATIGVVTGTSIADNAVGEICIFGEVEVRSKSVSGNLAWSGWPLLIGASGSVATVASDEFNGDSLTINTPHRIVGFMLGAKDDVSDTATVLMFWNPR